MLLSTPSVFDGKLIKDFNLYALHLDKFTFDWVLLLLNKKSIFSRKLQDTSMTLQPTTLSHLKFSFEQSRNVNSALNLDNLTRRQHSKLLGNSFQEKN